MLSKIKQNKINKGVTDFSCMSVSITFVNIAVLLLFSSFFLKFCNFSFVCKYVIKC